MLGCIPSIDPVRLPTDNDALITSGTHTKAPMVPNPSRTSPSPYQEIQDLRARLALLERSLNVKSEPVNRIVSARAAMQVKRERLDTDGGSGQKRQKRGGAAEVVDLTAD
ncbi:hypothetical protein MMC17_004181 [Xylographa soralifera]|nr:hypothetical protein [Xylographa soralifera]